MNVHKIEKGMQLILDGLGVKKDDHNFTDTPERYAKALGEMFNPEETEWATFQEDYTDFILLRNHRLFSLCPHHMLPVRLTASVAYIPNGNVLGLSKLARVLHAANDGPLLQEAFTKRVITDLHDICPNLRGAGCLIRGVHSCLEMRGVRSSADFVTYRFDGVFDNDPTLQQRFFQLAGLGGADGR